MCTRPQLRLALPAIFLIPLFLAACGAQPPSGSAPPATAPADATGAQTPVLPAPTELPAPAASAATAQAPTPPGQADAPPAGCTSPASLTPALTEGPYFKAGSPERTSLLDANTAGTKLVLTGYVRTRDCQPVAHALLDFWQADAAGQYDNTGYTLRGHQYTDAAGRYRLETIIPGLYPGRTEHIHFKVQAPNGPVLTSQLFFPGVPGNASDQIFDPKLVLPLQDTADGKASTFDFVVNAK
jgi:protocatechuate 3,4-dioxygenase beta subunit